MATDISRRDALKTGAALVTAPAILTVHAAADIVKFAVIGLGIRGSQLVSHLARLDTGRCVALCDLNPQAVEAAARKLTTNPKKYQNHHDVLSDKEVEAVFIAVPLAAHFELTRDALLAGKQVFCEPSLVLKPVELHSLQILAAEHSKQILQVGLQHRYSLYFQSVKRMIDQGVLGTVTHIHAQWHSNPGWMMQPGGRDNAKNWRMFRESSGGLTSELAVHHIDVANWFFGAPPEFIVGVGGLDFRQDGRDIFDNIQLIYSYPNGRKMVFSSITTCQHLPLLSSQRPEVGLVVMGTAGAVEMTFGTQNAVPTALWFREPEPSAPAAPQIGVPIMTPATEVDWKNDSFLLRESKVARRWLFDKGILLPEEDRSPVDAQFESFFNDVRSGNRPYANVEVGLANAAAVILSNIAMEQDRRVAFKEMDTMGIPAPAPPPVPVVTAPAANGDVPASAADSAKAPHIPTSTKPPATAKNPTPHTAPKAPPKVDPNP